MRNIRLTMEYDGTSFNGWQTQRIPVKKLPPKRKLKTVQEEIEKALKKIFDRRICLIGSGRTDAGVHAKAQIANFKVDTELSTDNIRNALNMLIPRSIAILSAEDVSLRFHSQFDAESKIYKYTILNRKVRSPLLNRYSAFCSYDLDIDAMKEACGYLIGKRDFKAFQASDKMDRDSVRTVTKIEIASNPPLIEMFIEADGFLYNMVRNIAGTLIEVGRGKIKPDKIKEILFKKQRKLAGPTAPSKGLCLEKVIYER